MAGPQKGARHHHLGAAGHPLALGFYRATGLTGRGTSRPTMTPSPDRGRYRSAVFGPATRMALSLRPVRDGSLAEQLRQF
jgi:hypothetical protein